MQNQPHLQQSNSSTGYYTANITQSLIAKAAPYIHIVNYYATVDPAIKTVLTTSEMHIVQTDVTKYNATPTAQKLPQSRSITPAQKAALFASQKTIQPYIWPWCTDSWKAQQQWWGWAVWMNSCMANDCAGGGALSLFLLELVATVITDGAAGKLLPYLVSFVMAELYELNWAEHECSDGSHNVFFDILGPIIPEPPLMWWAPAC